MMQDSNEIMDSQYAEDTSGLSTIFETKVASTPVFGVPPVPRLELSSINR